MRFTILASGSKGNALLVESGDTIVMIDSGLGPKRLSERMRQANVDAGRIKALCVTHHHYDHAKFAPEVAESLNIPTLATESCAKAQTKAGAPFFAHQVINTSVSVDVGPINIKAFATPHDAPGSVGFVFQDGDSRMATVTDLGCVHGALADAVRDVTLLYVEFNHDIPMLMNGPYPGFLKNRVASNVGHLCNEQGADLVARSRTAELKHIVLAHLSEQNNTPELAVAAARKVLDGSGVQISVAPQHEAMGPLEVGKRSAGAPSRPSVASVIRPPLQRPVLGGSRSASSSVGAGPQAQLSLFASPTAKP